MMLKNKSILVTGASKGIGKSIAYAMAEQGADLILASRNLDSLQELKKNIEEKHKVNVYIYKTDIRKIEEVQQLFAFLSNEKITIDVLVNNAGILQGSMLMMTSEINIKDTFETNVFGMFYITRLAVKMMVRKRSGSIINISSIMGLQGKAGLSIYSASKSAIIGFTKSLSKELAQFNIRVNAIAPGFIDTDMTKNLQKNEYDNYISNIGMKRAGRGEDVAKTVLFLASDLSEYVTGQVIGVDGGMII